MKKLTLLMTLILTLALLASCGTPAEAPGGPDDQEQTVQPEFTGPADPDNFYNPTWGVDLCLGMDRDEVERILEETREVPALAGDDWKTTYGCSVEDMISIAYSIEADQVVQLTLDATEGSETGASWFGSRDVTIGSSQEDVIAAFGQNPTVDEYDPHFITYYLNADDEVIPDGDDVAWMISFAFDDDNKVIYLCAQTPEALAHPVYGA